MSPGYKTLLFSLSFISFWGSVFSGNEISSQEYGTMAFESQYQFTIANGNLESVDWTDPDSIRMTADIISRFGVVALQGIRSDNAETDLYSLVDELDTFGYQYEFLLGPELEAAPSRYAFLYRTDLMYPIVWYSYYGHLEDDFGWVPFVARFEIDDGDFDLTLINFYTEPELSPWEIDLLPEIIDDVKERFPDEADIIVFCSANNDYNSPAVTDPFRSSLEQEGFIFLLDTETIYGAGTNGTVSIQIIIATNSDEMFWEDAELLEIGAESTTMDDNGVVSPTSQVGFSTITVVKNMPEDPGDKNEGASAKAFCFFGTASN